MIQSSILKEGYFSFLGLLLLLCSVIEEATPSGMNQRNHDNSSRRNIITESIFKHDANAQKSVSDYDMVSVDRYLRNYLTGPVDDHFMYLNYDTLAAYIGPTPLNPPEGAAVGTIRVWGMFDEKTFAVCSLNAIHDYGQIALFSCPQPGLYRVYAFDDSWEAGKVFPRPSKALFGKSLTDTWTSKSQKDPFDMMLGNLIGKFNKLPVKPTSVNERIQIILDEDSHELVNARSDPIVIEESVYCYYWMYRVVERARVGYVIDEVVPSVGINGSSYLLLDLMVWIAEPSAVQLDELSDDIRSLSVSDYSKLLTNRFYAIGLFPCLREAHSAVEIVSEISFVPDTDQNNPLNSAPHWKVVLKIHTDRLITTLSDVVFTIASRQNTAYFHCFVGDTRVFLNLRNFEFIQRKKLEKTSINLEHSNLWDVDKLLAKHQIKHVYGHGLQFIGSKWSKIFQPSTSRSDMIIVGNPCIAQEFAFSVGGSLYVAEGLLEKGAAQAKKVFLPDFRNPSSQISDPLSFRDYLRVLDMTFTPTHLVVLMADGYVLLHPSSISQKGVGRLTNVEKYQPAAIVKRRWCPRTSTPKLSSMAVPIFGRGGSIIILQIYPTEGSVRMWVTPPSKLCIPEGHGFVKVADDQLALINETDIHYNEFAAVNRSNHNTGIQEKPFDPRPEPPPPPPVNYGEELTFLLSGETRVGDGSDPHYPPEFVNPASRALSEDLTDYNQAVIYVLDADKRLLTKTFEENGIRNVVSGTGTAKDDISLYTVEYTAVEKQFLLAAKFTGVEIPKDFASGLKQHPFQMLITTVTVSNFPFKVKLSRDYRTHDERLETTIPFPGIILMRSQPYTVIAVPSRDPLENLEHTKELAGTTSVEYTPEMFTMNTAIPSYVIDFGDILVVTSLEGRYARPLHFFEWLTFSSALGKSVKMSSNDSLIKFNRTKRLYDAVVTEQGIISVLWRKEKRHIVQDDEVCLVTTDSQYHQTVAMGSVVSLEGLREVKPFFRNDNVFQRATPDGEIIYGVYDVKPHSPFDSCTTDREAGDATKRMEVCIEQPKVPPDGVNPTKPVLKVCASGEPAPCRDPGYIQRCDLNTPPNPKHACLRVYHCPDTRISEDNFDQPTAKDPTLCDAQDTNVTGCLPDYSPREELRSVNILGTSFLSYLLGSIKSVSSLHPEAPPPSPDEPEEPDVCPFSSFTIYNTDFDFAEVGFRTRITGKISFFGAEIPTEADLLIEYERGMGILVEINSSIEEERGLTTVTKTIDLIFEMTDYTLYKFELSGDVNSRNTSAVTYEDIRARENTTVYSITLRPSIVNMRCKKNDFFKTIQFNVGCNAFSEIRLLSEVSPLKPVNWTELVTTSSDEFKWHRDQTGSWNLTIPAAHIYHQQLKANVFDCHDTDDDRKFCYIPYFQHFQNEIYTISYRDLFFPQFEQFFTVSSRRVSGNMVIYDLLGSKEFNLTVNKLQANCYSNGKLWYDRLVNTTKLIARGSSVHDSIYKYYKDCFKADQERDGTTPHREQPYQLHASPYNLINLTNRNQIKFRRNRNQLFIFRAVLVNTYFNRFSYCKLLQTFFMVRVTGIPIPRQGLALWHYILVMLLVTICFFISYGVFYKFYTWKLDLGIIQGSELDENRTEGTPYKAALDVEHITNARHGKSGGNIPGPKN